MDRHDSRVCRGTKTLNGNENENDVDACRLFKSHNLNPEVLGYHGHDLCGSNTDLLREKLPLPAHHGGFAQAARVQEGQDVEGQETWQHRGEVEVFQGHVTLEPLVEEQELCPSATHEDVL